MSRKGCRWRNSRKQGRNVIAQMTLPQQLALGTPQRRTPQRIHRCSKGGRVGVCVRGLFSAKVPNSSFAEVRTGLLIEPTHMEDEDEEQENEKEDERDGEECRVEIEEYLDNNSNNMRMTHG